MATAVKSSLINQNVVVQINSRSIWQDRLTSVAQFELFLKLTMEAISAFIEGKYTKFDAKTTTNCCHGIALISSALLHSLDIEGLTLTLDQLKKFGEQISLLEPSALQNMLLDELPDELFDLTTLYVLTYIREIHSGKRSLSKPLKLKEFAPVSSNFCYKIIRSLQKHLSNVAAYSFKIFLRNISESEVSTCGVPVGYWGKYVQNEFIRKDANGMSFVSCLYSMQIALSHLSLSKSIIGVINDYTLLGDESSGRDLHLLKGDGKGGFILLLGENDLFHTDVLSRESVVVFEGCSVRNSPTTDLTNSSLGSWIHNFPSLVLACDAHYPQFPKNAADPNFNSSRIDPEEEFLMSIISEYSKIGGVTYDDPSLFCLTHVYAASLSQILEIKHNTKSDELPCYFIPHQTISN